MQEDGGVDHYARHEELFKKRLSLLRESLHLVEQRRRLTKGRPSSPALKRIILRLKQSQADALDVKCKNQKLLQFVDDFLLQKQAQLPIRPAADVTTKELCWESSTSAKEQKLKEQKLDDTCSDVGQEEMAIIRAFDCDREQQHQATSHIKLQDLGSTVKTTETDAACLVPITSSSHEEVSFRKSKELSAQHFVSDLKAIIPHQTSIMTDKVDLHPIMSPESSHSVDVDNIVGKIQHQDILTNRPRVCIPTENTNELSWVACTDPPTLEKDLLLQPTQGTSNSEQQSEQLKHEHEKLLDHGEECSKPSLLLCVDTDAGTDVGDRAPSRFLQVADVGHHLHEQDKTLIRRKRAELAISPSKEKLAILVNIYSAIYQWECTLWAYESEQVWNPGLVFSTIEAARKGGEEVKKVLRSKDSGSRLLICCEAICELIHAFPPENLLPTEFVKECLLATGSVKADVHDWLKRNLLTTYQDVDSALFWDSLTRHAVYLVTHELATAKQVASIFTGILLPAARLKDTVKEAYENARVNLHIFIAILLGTKDVSAACSSQVKGCYISSGQDCDHTQLALCNLDGRHETQERESSVLLPIIQMPALHAEEQAKDELSAAPANSTNAPSCLSCSMLVKCLPWKKSKV